MFLFTFPGIGQHSIGGFYFTTLFLLFSNIFRRNCFCQIFRFRTHLSHRFWLLEAGRKNTSNRKMEILMGPGVHVLPLVGKMVGNARRHRQVSVIGYWKKMVVCAWGRERFCRGYRRNKRGFAPSFAVGSGEKRKGNIYLAWFDLVNECSSNAIQKVSLAWRKN